MTCATMTDIDTDDDALKRCLEIAKRDRETHELMKEKPLNEAMENAAYHCQHAALSLKTWQEPPCVADEDDPHPRDPGAQKLLRELLQHNISRYEPDPLAALHQVKRRRK